MVTYGKSLGRMLRDNLLRISAVSFIIAIGVSIVTGLGAMPDRIKDAVSAGGLSPMQIAMATETADKVELLGFIFPLFFVIVAALTAFTTVTRLCDEDRLVIASLKTLGYSKASIIMRYIMFALMCSVTGCTIGLLAGNFLLGPVLFEAVKTRFGIPDPAGSVYLTKGILWSAVMIASIVLTALYIGLKGSKGKPAVLLRPKAPKPGRKILLERIPVFWNGLKFKYKSAVRNIVRYKGKLIMTVLSVAGSTIIVFCGLGLLFSLKDIRNQPVQALQGFAVGNDFVDSILPISLALTLSAVLLTVLVLFNLTNINIGERKREIATLKVLGYKKTEVAGYIFREIAVLAGAGIILGVPSGYFILGFIFDFVEFGSIEFIKWHVWVLTAAIALFSVLLTDVLLYRKIDKTDMLGSLKTVE